MKIEFMLDHEPAEVRRNHKSGRAELQVGAQVFLLASPYDPRSHVGFSTRRSWRRTVNGHEVEIVKVRPRINAGFKAHEYTILIDGATCASASGI
jgi:hypothetical protein